MASFTNDVNWPLAKRPLKTNGRLANRQLTPLVKKVHWSHLRCIAHLYLSSSAGILQSFDDLAYCCGSERPTLGLMAQVPRWSAASFQLLHMNGKRW